MSLPCLCWLQNGAIVAVIAPAALVAPAAASAAAAVSIPASSTSASVARAASAAVAAIPAGVLALLPVATAPCVNGRPCFGSVE